MPWGDPWFWLGVLGFWLIFGALVALWFGPVLKDRSPDDGELYESRRIAP